ncbi:hypothetical protein H4582DRAFT_1955719, partial [Lactarius indigo]
MKWIDPLVHVLYTFSGALGDGVSLAFPPAKVIFTGLVSSSLSAFFTISFVDIPLSRRSNFIGGEGLPEQVTVLSSTSFERIESFFKRLGVYYEDFA